MLTNDTFLRCPKTKWVCVALYGDDKVWCGACGRTHLPSEMTPATEQDLDNQVLMAKGNLGRRLS